MGSFWSAHEPLSLRRLMRRSYPHAVEGLAVDAAELYVESQLRELVGTGPAVRDWLARRELCDMVGDIIAGIELADD